MFIILILAEVYFLNVSYCVTCKLTLLMFDDLILVIMIDFQYLRAATTDLSKLPLQQW